MVLDIHPEETRNAVENTALTVNADCLTAPLTPRRCPPTRRCRPFPRRAHPERDAPHFLSMGSLTYRDAIPTLFHFFRSVYEQPGPEVRTGPQADLTDRKVAYARKQKAHRPLALLELDFAEGSASHQPIERDWYLPPEFDSGGEILQHVQVEDSLVVGGPRDYEAGFGWVGGGVGLDVNDVEVSPSDIVVVANEGGEPIPVGRRQRW